MEDAITAIKGAKCPPDLLGSSGTIDYLEVLDFEGSRPSGYSESGSRVSVSFSKSIRLSSVTFHSVGMPPSYMF